MLNHDINFLRGEFDKLVDQNNPSLDPDFSGSKLDGPNNVESDNSSTQNDDNSHSKVLQAPDDHWWFFPN